MLKFCKRRFQNLCWGHNNLEKEKSAVIAKTSIYERLFVLLGNSINDTNCLCWSFVFFSKYFLKTHQSRRRRKCCHCADFHQRTIVEFSDVIKEEHCFFRIHPRRFLKIFVKNTPTKYIMETFMHNLLLLYSWP